ncbi:CD1247 N-terminal domain-containing protein [Pseudoflavonifractor sp. HCP28S3_F10]|uniref:CD1247 N-terminal domain-containing protein n=1 Tax=Pseudoflavonifractor sp. HCP28S3_F10 TaxID=3438947 RepID=UPI003F894830
MTISEKVAYLKGLAEGLNIDTEKSKEGKLISVMIGILEEIGLSIEDLEENTVALGEEIDAISDDLSDVESVVFEEDDDDGDCCCDDDDDDDDFFEVECPNCKETLVIDEDVLESGVIQCPSCKEKFALDLSDCDCCCDEDEDDCGCGCGCHDEE